MPSCAKMPHIRFRVVIPKSFDLLRKMNAQNHRPSGDKSQQSQTRDPMYCVKIHEEDLQKNLWSILLCICHYGVATISGLLKIIRLFCKRAL